MSPVNNTCCLLYKWSHLFQCLGIYWQLENATVGMQYRDGWAKCLSELYEFIGRSNQSYTSHILLLWRRCAGWARASLISLIMFNKKFSRDSSSRRPLSRSRSFKVTDCSTNRKPICDFLIMNILTYSLSRAVFQLSRSYLWREVASR